jgi:hypothetical protein
MSFEQEFLRARAQNLKDKLAMMRKRVLDVQLRAKIKPSAFNPVLLNK